MSITITIEKKKHIGNYSIPFIEGVYDAVLIKYETDSYAGRKYMKVTGVDFNYDIEVGVGTCPVDIVPSIDYDYLKNNNLTKEHLKDYLADFTELDYKICCEANSTKYDELNIKRYIQTVVVHKMEVGGYERNKSYATILTSDNLNTFAGYKQGASWINIKVDYEPIIDTDNVTIVDI